MGDYKRSVKNKARVEGSICGAYLHRETIYFCSHYFNNFMLSTNNRNQMDVEEERHPLTLSVFSKPGRPSGKKSASYLSDKEHKSAHVHILINCTEIKPYLE